MYFWGATLRGWRHWKARGLQWRHWKVRGLQSSSWAPFAIESRGLWHNENVKQWFHFIHCGRSRFPEKPHSSNQSINNWIWFRKWVRWAGAAMLRLTSCWPSYTPATYCWLIVGWYDCTAVGDDVVSLGVAGVYRPHGGRKRGQRWRGKNDRERMFPSNCAC